MDALTYPARTRHEQIGNGDGATIAPMIKGPSRKTPRDDGRAQYKPALHHIGQLPYGLY